MHHDETAFADPYEFKPTRFLDDDDGSYVGDDGVYMFGPGRRRCPGEALARAELFLYLTALVQQFKITARDPESLSLSGVQRFVIYPRPYEFLVEERVK